tara:strand:- start:38 stop:238 length:201 start_codon:yes stop_codon:yes gene_type:complete
MKPAGQLTHFLELTYWFAAHVAATVSHWVKTSLVSPVLTSPAAFVLPVAHAVTVPAVVASAPSAEA